MIRNAWNNMKTWGFFVGAIVSIIAIAYYICFPMGYYYTSDYADTLFWTQAMFDGGKIFNPDFEYAATLPFGGQWFYAPFYLLFGMSMTTQICGQIFYLLCLSACILLLARSLKFSWAWSWTSILCILGVLSSCEKMREVYFAHILYYGLGSLFLFLFFALLIQTENFYKDNKCTILLIVLGLVMLLCNTNGVPTLSICTIPILCAFLFVTFIETKSLKRDTRDFSTIFSVGFCLGMSIVGVYLGKLLIGKSTAGYQQAFTMLTASGNWGENLVNLFQSYFEIFTGALFHSTDFVSKEGIDVILRLGLATALAVLPVCALFSITKIKSRGARIYVITHFIMTAILLLGFVFGNMNNAAWRLTPSIVSGVFVSVLYLRHLWSTKDIGKRIGGLLTFLAITICLLLSIETLLLPAKNIYVGNERALTDKLEEDQFTYGYATFWNANAVTALSNEKVKIRNISIDEDGRIAPDFYQSNLNWYSGQNDDKEKYVLVLTSSEYTQLSDIYSQWIQNEEKWESFYLLELKFDLF